MKLYRNTGDSYDNWRAAMEYPDGSLVVTPPKPTPEQAEVAARMLPLRPDETHINTPRVETLDEVNPDHYKFRGIETIDWMEAQAPTQSHFTYHCRMQAQKYLARAGRKRSADAHTDMAKCTWWINKYLESLGKEMTQ